jgi:hypothetical protein
VPVNDMENGRIFFGVIWAGLSDVTSTMQEELQRVWVYKVAVAFCGTINIVTTKLPIWKLGNVYHTPR